MNEEMKIRLELLKKEQSNLQNIIRKELTNSDVFTEEKYMRLLKEFVKLKVGNF